MRKGLGWLILPLFTLVLGIAHAQPGKVTYVYTDPQGTPLAEADANGNITATFDYKPYGSQALGSPPTGPGYIGHVNDPDTGFVYMQARYYDPIAGRFLAVDPRKPVSGELFNFNRYAYANNNPQRYIDRDGQNPGDAFHTPEMAALDALRYINGMSISTNHEYMGYIIVSNGQFVATSPVQISETGGNSGAPENTKIVGDYHTHGNYSIRNSDGTITVTGDPQKDNLNSDNFSPSDKNRYQELAKLLGQYRGYLGTPGQKYYIYYNGAKGDLSQIVQQQQEEGRKRQERQREQEKKRDEQGNNG